ncbi:MAG: hypothetical protein HC905_29435 [Bacteroidales bacterium]|nr:hypothetical protein [Bacteroidales bacterium]
MNKISIYLLAFSLITQVVTGCKKDDKGTETPIDPNKRAGKSYNYP